MARPGGPREQIGGQRDGRRTAGLCREGQGGMGQQLLPTASSPGSLGEPHPFSRARMEASKVKLRFKPLLGK